MASKRKTADSSKSFISTIVSDMVWWEKCLLFSLVLGLLGWIIYVAIASGTRYQDAYNNPLTKASTTQLSSFPVFGVVILDNNGCLENPDVTDFSFNDDFYENPLPNLLPQDTFYSITYDYFGDPGYIGLGPVLKNSNNNSMLSLSLDTGDDESDNALIGFGFSGTAYNASSANCISSGDNNLGNFDVLILDMSRGINYALANADISDVKFTINLGNSYNIKVGATNFQSLNGQNYYDFNANAVLIDPITGSPDQVKLSFHSIFIQTLKKDNLNSGYYFLIDVIKEYADFTKDDAATAVLNAINTLATALAVLFPYALLMNTPMRKFILGDAIRGVCPNCAPRTHNPKSRGSQSEVVFHDEKAEVVEVSPPTGTQVEHTT